MRRWTAHYRCLRCSHEWQAPAGPERGECPACGHLYATWLNYDELAKRRGVA